MTLVILQFHLIIKIWVDILIYQLQKMIMEQDFTQPLNILIPHYQKMIVISSSTSSTSEKASDPWFNLSEKGGSLIRDFFFIDFFFIDFFFIDFFFVFMVDYIYSKQCIKSRWFIPPTRYLYKNSRKLCGYFRWILYIKSIYIWKFIKWRKFREYILK